MSNKKMRLNCLLIVSILLLTILQSCSSYKKVPYFQNVPDSSYVYQNGELINGVNKEAITIKSDDILNIKVLLKDGSDALMPILPNSTSNIRQDDNKNLYRVDPNGNIQVPVLGIANVGGLTLTEIRKKLQEEASKSIKNPIVQVELENFTVTILGEVAKPGIYNIVNKDKLTIMDVIGLSGDLTISGKRNNIMLIRDLGNGKKQIGRLDIQNSNFFKSPYYNLQQNDIVYVEPTKFRASSESFQKVSFVTGFAAILSVVVSVIALSK